jgi:hypothetical protein
MSFDKCFIEPDESGRLRMLKPRTRLQTPTTREATRFAGQPAFFRENEKKFSATCASVSRPLQNGFAEPFRCAFTADGNHKRPCNTILHTCVLVRGAHHRPEHVLTSKHPKRASSWPWNGLWRQVPTPRTLCRINHTPYGCDYLPRSSSLMHLSYTHRQGWCSRWPRPPQTP